LTPESNPPWAFELDSCSGRLHPAWDALSENQPVLEVSYFQRSTMMVEIELSLSPDRVQPGWARLAPQDFQRYTVQCNLDFIPT